MFWLFSLAVAGGLIAGVPPLMRRRYGPDPASNDDRARVIGAVLLFGGLAGLLAVGFDIDALPSLLAAACVGMAAAALSPEILSTLAPQPTGQDDPAPAPADPV